MVYMLSMSTSREREVSDFFLPCVKSLGFCEPRSRTFDFLHSLQSKKKVQNVMTCVLNPRPGNSEFVVRPEMDMIKFLFTPLAPHFPIFLHFCLLPVRTYIAVEAH